MRAIMRNNVRFLMLVLAISSIMPYVAHAATPGSMEIVNTALKTAASSAVAKLQTTAILWLSAFVGLQFLITNLGLLKSGADLEAVFGKLMGSLLWFGFCFYVMTNGVDFIDKVSQQFFTTAGEVSGTGLFSAGYILDKGVDISTKLLTAIDGVTGTLDFLPSIIAGIVGVVILATAALIGFKVFLIKLEVTLVIMLAPLSFAFLGLNVLKDQGIAPFKALISLAYRILLLGVIVSAMGTVGDSLLAVISQVDTGSITAIWRPIFGALFGYVLLGYLAFRSDSIASSLASGGTSMGTGDVASAAAMGAAAGAAVATGGAAAVAGATKSGQTMGDFLKGLSGGTGGSVSNASGSGSGGSEQKPVGSAPPPPAQSPVMSLQEMRNHPSSIENATQQAPSVPEKSSAPSAVADKQNNPESASSSTGSSSKSPVPSGLDAGIGGPGGGAQSTDQKLDKLMTSLGQPAQKPSLSDRMGTLNDHIAKEQSATHVSINANAAD